MAGGSLSLCPCQSPAEVMGTALWLSCASAGASLGSLAQTEPLPLSFIPAILGGRTKGGQGRAGCLSPELGAFMAVLTASPVLQRVREAGASHQSQERLVGSAAQSSVSSHLPAHLLTVPLSPSCRVPEQSTGCSCSFLGFEGLPAWTRLPRKEWIHPGARPAAPIAAGSQGRWVGHALQRWGEVCHHAQQPRTGTPRCSQRPGSDGIRWQEPAGPGRALSLGGSISTYLLDNSRTDL